MDSQSLKVGVNNVPWYWMYFMTSLNVSLQVKCYEQRLFGEVEGGQGCDAKLMSLGYLDKAFG